MLSNSASSVESTLVAADEITCRSSFELSRAALHNLAIIHNNCLAFIAVYDTVSFKQFLNKIIVLQNHKWQSLNSHHHNYSKVINTMTSHTTSSSCLQTSKKFCYLLNKTLYHFLYTNNIQFSPIIEVTHSFASNKSTISAWPNFLAQSTARQLLLARVLILTPKLSNCSTISKQPLPAAIISGVAVV